MPDWVRHAVWWHVYPLGFVGAEDEALPAGHPVEHRLDRVTGWLDHLIELGANGLLLGPVFASMSHGYDTVDFLRVDARLGDEADLDRLLSAAADRGIQVLFDGVFNHVGSAHPLVRDAERDGPGSAAARYLRRELDGSPSYFEGQTQLVQLDHESEEVADLVVDVMTSWLDRGIAGWRLDAAFAVPAPFWARVLPRVRERFPDAWFVAELIQADAIRFADESGVDSVTAYELWKAIWSSLHDRNLYELDWTLGRHASLLEHCVPQTFLSNHDVTRVASQISDARLHPHAAALLLFLPGVPSIYYGDEYGFSGVKEDRLGGDAAIRPTFPTQPAELASNATLNTYRELVGLRRRHPWLVDARTSTDRLSNTTLEVTATARNGSERLVLALNLGEEPVDRSIGAVLAGADAAGRLPATSWAIVRPD